MAKRVYVCDTCGALADEPGHLCSPKGHATCSYCGDKDPHVSHMCKGKMDDLKYVCNKCGRLATSGDFLCDPAAAPTKV